MTFKAQLTTDLGVFFNTDEFAESGTYTDTNGSTSTVSYILDYEENLDEERRGQAEKAVLYVRKDQISDPKYRETIGSWTFVKIREGDTGIWIIEVRQDERGKLA